jgi:hypothetical protein
MPVIKRQDELAQSTRKLQPKKDSSVVQLILAYDLCGWKNKRISEQLGICESRISIIKSSPMYKAQRAARWEELQAQTLDKSSDKISDGDPVQKQFDEFAPEAAKLKVELARTAQSEMVRNAALSECIEKSRFGAKQTKMKTSIEVSEKIADRFLKIHELDNRRATLRIETETDL